VLLLTTDVVLSPAMFTSLLAFMRVRSILYFADAKNFVHRFLLSPNIRLDILISVIFLSIHRIWRVTITSYATLFVVERIRFSDRFSSKLVVSL